MKFILRRDPFVEVLPVGPGRGSRGAALVIVLAFLVLVTVLVVAFFGTVSSEYGAAKITADVEAGRQLAETTVQIAMGQIRTATSQPGKAWASQPGMIRTYDDAGRSDEVFALYSTSAMRRSVGGGAFDPAADLPGAAWAADRAFWVDLNAPAEGRSGQPVFPVIDPRAAGEVSPGLPLVEGFSYSSSAISGAVSPTGTSDPAARLPMPVRWIYVLRDGSLSVPSGGSGDTATFAAPSPVPTADNPVVGRLAFWTDDETCKLNVNTACGGVPWDTPIGNSGLEMLFARYQPAKNEFSRYPGHPASVSLAPVFWSYLGMASPTDSVFPAFTPNWNTTQPMASGPALSAAATAFRDKIFPLIPRNTFGGSAMATKTTADVSTGLAALAAVDSDRLFGSADELLYGPNEGNTSRAANPLGLSTDDIGKLNFFVTAQSRAPEVNLFNLPKIVLWPLPDATLKSVQNANAVAGNTRSPLDNLIAFCAALSYDNGTKKREYGFTRHDANSPTNDIAASDAEGTKNNQILYSYLDSLMGRPLPGFGSSFSTRYGANGTRQILTGVYDFIRSQINLVDSSNSAADPASASNLDGAFVSRFAYAAANAAGNLGTGGLANQIGQVIPAQMPNGTRGSGRVPVLSQIAVEFIARAANQPPGSPMHPGTPAGNYPTIDIQTDSVATAYDPARPTDFHTHPGLRYLTVPATSGGTNYTVQNPRYRGPALAEFETEIEPALLVAFQLPGAGVPGYRAAQRIRIRGLNNLKANGVSLFPAYDSQIVTLDPGNSVLQFNIGPAQFPAGSYLGNGVIVGSAADSGRTFLFNGGSIEVELLHPTDSSIVVQTYQLTFPPATLPTPLLPNSIPSDNRSRSEHSFWAQPASVPYPPTKAIDLPPSSLLTFDPASVLSTNPNHPGPAVTGYTPNKHRRSPGDSTTYANVILPEWPVANDYRGKLSSDTVRSLEVAYGDSRMLSQLRTVPADFFLPHRFYYDTKMRAAHSFRGHQHETQFEHLQGATLQYLTESAATAAATLPGYGGAWSKTDPNPGNLWDVATGDDVRRMTYNRWVAGNAVVSSKWPFTASTCEFDADKFTAYKNSGAAVSSLRDFPTLWQHGGDFNNGIPGVMDGSMIGKVDEGNNFIFSNQGLYPYFNSYASTSISAVGPNLFSPNRQVPSPVVLGSLPAGYRSTFDPANPKLGDLTPWRTLLFAPNPVGVNHEALAEVADGGNVPVAATAPDFTLLDFFWMPVVEPYAISEPLSTAGKVNMNSQIAPFTYITRNTALRGVMRSTLITAVPDKWLDYKNTTGSGSANLKDLGGSSSSINYANFRYPINAPETLRQFQKRFDAGDIFRSASEICSLWLYPDKRSASDAAGPVWDAAASNIKSWWYANPGTESKSVTGDNLREKPYATLYPLLTTKSNTYTVHFKVQTLQKGTGTAEGQWVEGRDRVTSEYQGSQTIERYVDPMDAKLIDFATQTASTDPTISDFYRFRILSNKRFTP